MPASWPELFRSYLESVTVREELCSSTHRADSRSILVTQRPIDAIEMPADRSSKPRSTSTARTFIIAAYALLTAGWAANHFSTMLAVLRDQAEFSPVVVNGAFGIYAL